MITPAKLKLLREQLRSVAYAPVHRTAEQAKANPAMSGSQKEK